MGFMPPLFWGDGNTLTTYIYTSECDKAKVCAQALSYNDLHSQITGSRSWTVVPGQVTLR